MKMHICVNYNDNLEFVGCIEHVKNIYNGTNVIYMAMPVS